MPVSVGYSVSNLTALKAINTVELIDGYAKEVIAQKCWYFYISSATNDTNEPLIVVPTSGIGRWFSAKIIESGSVGDSEISSISQNKIINLITDLANKAPLTHSHLPSHITNFDTYTKDLMASTLFAGTGISINYNSTTGRITINAGGAGTTGFIADTLSVNSPSLIPGNSAIVSALTQPLLTARKINTTYPARIRIYHTSAYASSDLNRSITTELTGNHGCLLEVVTTPSYQALDLTPAVQLYSTETTPRLYISFTNLDNSNRIIPLVLDVYRW